MKIDVEVPQNASALFRHLLAGGYLSSNHPEPKYMHLYRECEKYEEGLRKLWSISGVGLVKEEGLFYFEDLNEDDCESTEVDKKLQSYLPFIRFHILLSRIYDGIEIGAIFSLADIETKVLENISLSKHYKKKDKDSIRKEIEKEVKLFQNAGYLYCIDTLEQKYIVLNAFQRLLDFLSLIAIEGMESIKDEMHREIEILKEETVDDHTSK